MYNDTNPLALTTTTLLHHISETFAKQSDQLLMERLGVGLSQFKIMQIVQGQPQATQRFIADKLGQTEASISRQIGILHDKHLAMTRINPDNRRERQTLLTPKGQRLFDEATRVLDGYTSGLYEGFSDKTRSELHALLKKIHTHTCTPGKIGSCQ